MDATQLTIRYTEACTELKKKIDFFNNLPIEAKIEEDALDFDQEVINKCMGVPAVIVDRWIMAIPVLRYKTAIVPRFTHIVWNIQAIKEYPGSFNPYDGGYPPEIDYEEIGEYSANVLREIFALYIKNYVDGVMTNYCYACYTEQLEEEKRLADENL